MSTELRVEGPHERARNIQYTWRTDGSESIRIASSDAQLVEAELDPFGGLTFRMRGRPPQGEQESESPAWILVDRLNQFGADWSRPRRPEGPERGVDFEASDGSHELQIQITRAFADSSTWRELALHSDVVRELRIENAAEKLWEAIADKAVRIAPTARRTIVLGLDTSAPAGFAPMRLMIDFKKRYAVAVREFGFQSVWLVGPMASLTWRIDEPFLEGEPIRIGL